MGKSKDLASGAAYQDQTESDTRYVNTAGDTMSGALAVNAALPKIQSSYNSSKHLEFGVGGSGGGFAMTTGHFMTVNHQPYADRATDNNLTERFRIDASGRVTMPYQPAFRAYLTTNLDITSQQQIVYPAVLYNRGSHYNTSNGRFTAPVTGVYHFGAFHWHKISTAGQVLVYFYVNGSLNAEFRHSRNGATGYYDRVGFNHDILLNANDYVTVEVEGAGGGNLHTSSGFSFSYFAGRLVG